MDQPWGLSGPQFIAIYVAAFLGALVLLIAVQALLSRVGSGVVGADVRLDVFEAAYLAGGLPRLVDTAIAALALRDQLLVARGGRLTAVRGAFGSGPVESAVCGVVARNTPRSAVYRRLRRDPALLAVAEQVGARGLVLVGGRRLIWWLVGLLPAAVFAIGVARAVNGVRLHRPVQTLVMLLVISLIIGVLVARRARRTRLSPVGRAALGALRRQYRHTGRSTHEFELVGVAMLGYVAIADPSLRLALSTSPSSGNGYSGGASDGGGCGGGGGGGGGCGGGGGGGGCGG